jgi:hypothetical protein
LPRAVDAMLDDKLNDTTIYAHLDEAYGFWQVRVREEEAHIAKFKYIYDLMEWVAMPLGMCNAPVTFHHIMNEILRDYFTQVRKCIH